MQSTPEMTGMTGKTLRPLHSTQRASSAKGGRRREPERDGENLGECAACKKMIQMYAARSFERRIPLLARLSSDLFFTQSVSNCLFPDTLILLMPQP